MRQDYKHRKTAPDTQAKLARKKSQKVGQDFLHNKPKKTLIERLLS